MSKVLDNKFIKFLIKFIKVVVWIFVLLVIFVILVQRIFNNQVSIGSYRMFTVVTGSMEPVYNVGDVVISKEVDPSTIKKGDDVVYLGEKDDFKDKIVTHRVIKIEKKEGDYYFTTKGVANEYSDPVISSDQIYGKVVYRPVVLSFLSGILNTRLGFYLLIFVPVAFLIFLEILDYIKRKEGELYEGEKTEVKEEN